MICRIQAARCLRRGAMAALLVSVAAGAVHAETSALGAGVAGLLEHARVHNPAFAADSAVAAAARERVEPAGALPDPRFQVELMDITNAMRGGSTTLLPGEVGETRYRIIQPLPGWGKRSLSAQAASVRAEQAHANRDAAWRDLAAAIERAWLRYYAADREAVLNRDGLALLRDLEEITLSRYRLGLLPQQAVLRAQREISAQRLKLIAVEQRRRGEAAALNALLGRAPDGELAAPLAPESLPAARDLASLMARVRAEHPAILAEARGIDAARLERDRTWRDRYPDFGIGLTHNRPRGGSDSWDVMLEVTIPLQQSSRRAREREAALMVTAADAKHAAAAAKLLGELGTAYAAFDSGGETLRLLRGGLLPQVEATRDATRAAFANDRAEFDAVLDAEQQLVETRLAILRADIETRMAMSEIERLVGDMP